MKTQILPAGDTRKRILSLAFLLLTILVLMLISGCPPDDEDTWRITEDGIISTWILKSAEFREPVDLDGPGNIMPTTDAKTVLFDLFNVYVNCSSIEEIAFEFTDEPAKNKDAMGPYGYVAYSANAVCPQGQGITSWIFDYVFYDYEDSDYDPLLVLYKVDINDPFELFDWTTKDIWLKITHSEIINGKYTISGHSNEDTWLSSLPDPKPDLTFDFTFERVDPHLN